MSTFNDVPPTHWAYSQIEAVAAADITSGCGGFDYCPDEPVTRAEMAVFLERAMRGGDFTPPAPQGIFTDVPTDHWAAAFIELMSADGITGGCGGTDFCPEREVTRDEMAIFLERAAEWPAPFEPPAATGNVFLDVPFDHWAAAWIEEVAADGITGGCGGDGEGNDYYCPDNVVQRDEMAVFLSRAFGL